MAENLEKQNVYAVFKIQLPEIIQLKSKGPGVETLA